jgi:hypothetical protein
MNAEKEDVAKDLWLVRLSVVCAVFLEVFQMEGSLIYGQFSGDGVAIAVTKGTSLTLILAPWLVYCGRNGLGALGHVRGSFVLVVIIVIVNLLHNLVFLGAAYLV